MSPMQKHRFPKKTKTYPFGVPYSDQVVSIDSLIEFLGKLKSNGNTHISLTTKISRESEAMAEFYAIQYEEESNESFLNRIGLSEEQSKLNVLESLLEAMYPEVLNDMRFSFAMKWVDEYTEKGGADQE